MCTNIINLSSFCKIIIFILCFFTSSAFALKPEFSLYNTENDKITENELQGQFSLVIFGYRQCPNTCPISLNIIAQTMKSLEPELSKNIQPIFISVDTKRDSAESLRSFVKAFHPKMIALTGTPDEIKKASYNFKVFYSKQLSRDPNNYEISHSSSTFLLGQNGEILTRYQFGTSATAMIKDLQKRLNAVPVSSGGPHTLVRTR